MKSALLFIGTFFSLCSFAGREDFKELYVLPGFAVGFQVDFAVFNRVYPSQHPVLGKKKFKRTGHYEYPGHLKIKINSNSKALLELEILSQKALEYLASLKGGEGLKKMLVRVKAWDFKKVYGKPESSISDDWFVYKDHTGQVKDYSLHLSLDRKDKKLKKLGVRWQWVGAGFSPPLAKQAPAHKERTDAFKKRMKKSARKRSTSPNSNQMINREFSFACHDELLKCGVDMRRQCNWKLCNGSRAEKTLYTTLLEGRKAVRGDRKAKKNLRDHYQRYIYSRTLKSTRRTVAYYVVKTYAYYKDPWIFGEEIGLADPTNVSGYGPAYKKLGLVYFDPSKGHGHGRPRKAVVPSYSDYLKRRMGQLGKSVEGTFKKASDWKAKGYNQNQVDEENARRALKRQNK